MFVIRERLYAHPVVYSVLSSLNLLIRSRETFTVTLIVLYGVGWKMVIDDPMCVPLRPSDTGWSVGR